MDQRLLIPFLAYLSGRGLIVADLHLTDVDVFITTAGHRWGKKTVARLCTCLRSFTRFLHGQGYLAHDLAPSIAAPRILSMDRPPRALPWSDVQRLLSIVDGARPTGRRDYALLLMMATYGMGAAEVLHLELGDIDWRRTVIQAYRPKTKVRYTLPLLPGVAQALSAYLRDGRPQHPTTRKIFVAAVAPHGPMSSSAIRSAIRQYAKTAGITAKTLGGHVLRHSHACRQIELGVPTQAIGDILGHRDPASTSSYIRVATERLRGMALPVPR